MNDTFLSFLFPQPSYPSMSLKLVYSYHLMVYLNVRAMKFIALLDLPKYTGLNFHLSSPLLSFHPRYEIHQSQIPYAHY